MPATRVMVVEDERVVALNIKRRLINMGYEVPTFASSGAQALAKIKQSRPDVVLMDIHINGDMDGIETAAQIPRDLHIPVIYLTAYSGDETLQRAQATRPDGYLLKPFSERELHATIQMVIARRADQSAPAVETAPASAPVQVGAEAAPRPRPVLVESRRPVVAPQPPRNLLPPACDDSTNTRWGSGTRSDPTSARNRLLDAALLSYRRCGIANTSVEDIALEAKITRTTVYRYFDSHPEIVKAVIRRELSSFWQGLNPHLAALPSFGEYLVEMLVHTLSYAQSQAGKEFLFSAEALPTLLDILLGDKAYQENLQAMLQPVFRRYAGGSDNDADLLALCEWFNRILASYLARPSMLFPSQEDLHNLLQRWLPVRELPKS